VTPPLDFRVVVCSATTDQVELEDKWLVGACSICNVLCDVISFCPFVRLACSQRSRSPFNSPSTAAWCHETFSCSCGRWRECSRDAITCYF
jgi:hypothetical protein